MVDCWVANLIATPAIGGVRWPLPVGDVGVAEPEQRLQRLGARRGAAQAMRMAVRRRALEFRLRRFAKTLLGFHEGGIEQRRQMLVERLQFRPRGFGAGRPAGFFGAEMGGNMGEVEGRGREDTSIRPN